MYILRRPDGSEFNRAAVEEDVWAPLWPSIPWPELDGERVMKWVKAMHLGRGWTVEYAPPAPGDGSEIGGTTILD